MFDHIFDDFVDEIKNGKHSFLRFEQININAIAQFASNLRKQYSYVGIIGFGASSLNIRSICSAITTPSKKTIYLDSVDEVDIEEKLALIDIQQTIFFVLSKSGNTEETYLLTQYLLEAKKVNNENICIITNKNNNLLSNLAKDFNILLIEHEQHISGRFGIIATASLLPASVIGVDTKVVVESAIKALADTTQNQQNIMGKAKYYLDNYLLGRRILVKLNYCHQLEGLCLWQQQLIGESLGKNNFGITPILSRGTFDEHSQLQLYLAGPDDKFYEIITHERHYTISKNLTTHANNIYKALVTSKRPASFENFTYINEQAIVSKIIESIFVTVIIARHQKIDPFNQTAVDACKISI
jgi:glucose-6-phosphate isomerase